MKLSPYFFSLILMISACATVVTPGGGEIDKSPPVVTQMDPPNETTNFNSGNIVFHFDEYIQLKENGNQIIISPPLSSKEFKLKKKRLELILPDDLQANTTYSIQFGTSVSDITEGNVLDTFAYIFSTGSFLDSLLISGKVIDAITSIPADGITVMLYKNDSDTLPYKTKPSYFTKTNSEGEFTLRNLSPGKYKLFALKDANSNFLFDPPAEAIAFHEAMIDAGTDEQYDLRLFKELPVKTLAEKVVSQRPARVQISFNKPVDSLKILDQRTGSELQNIAFSEWSTGRDTFNFWMSDSLVDTLKLVLKTPAEIIDSISVSMKARAASNLGRDQGLRNTGNTLNVGQGAEAEPGIPLILKIENPIRIIDTTFIYLKTDSAALHPWHIANSNSREIRINYVAEEGRSYQLCFMPGAWEDIYGKQNDTLCVDFKVRSSRENGNLNIHFTKPESSSQMIIQLLDIKDKVVATENIKSSSDVNFNYILPGEYKLRVIDDMNVNGRLDSGSWLKKMQPEKVYYYKDKLTVRANWDFEITWDLNNQE